MLALTGSTSLMGLIMAAFTIPRVLLSPFAGAFVDRNYRKIVMVAVDFIRGGSIVTIGLFAFWGFTNIWFWCEHIIYEDSKG